MSKRVIDTDKGDVIGGTVRAATGEELRRINQFLADKTSPFARLVPARLRFDGRFDSRRESL